MSLEGLQLDHAQLRAKAYEAGYKRGCALAFRDYHTRLLMNLEEFQKAMAAAYTDLMEDVG